MDKTLRALLTIHGEITIILSSKEMHNGRDDPNMDLKFSVSHLLHEAMDSVDRAVTLINGPACPIDEVEAH